MRAGRIQHAAVWLALVLSPLALTHPSGSASERRSSPAGASAIVRGPYLQLARPTGMVVRWRTSQPGSSRVWYGEAPDQLTSTRDGGGFTTEHEVTLDGLEPATRYYYAVGEQETVLSGDQSHTFVTPPAAGTPVPARFWVLGDSGTANANAAAVRDAYADFTVDRPTSLWLMLGDNAYERGRDSEFQAALFETYPQWLRRLPLWPTYGNHDSESADAGSQTGVYFDIFTLPRAAEAGGVASGTEAYYSFDYASVHFVCLDSSESHRGPGGAMLDWLARDLAATDQQWVIAYFHHAPYTKGSHDSDREGTLIEMREWVLPVLEAGGTDLVLAGHSHGYERSYLLDGHYGHSSTLRPSMIRDAGDGREEGNGAYFKPSPAGTANQGTVYVVAGASGKLSHGPLDHPAMYFSLLELGSMVLDVYGNRLDALYLDADGRVRDSFTLLKGSDRLAPAVISARARSADEVAVLFAEPLDPGSASDPSRFAIDRGVVVRQARLEPDGRTVVLSTSPLAGGDYTLAVEGLADRAGNRAAAASVGFDFALRQVVEFQEGSAPGPGYSGARDTYISLVDPDDNFGSLDLVRGDGIGREPALLPLLYWDVSDVPAGARVESAEIGITLENSSGGFYHLYEMRRDWSESQATWRRYAAGRSWTSPGTSAPSDRGSQSLSRIAPSRRGLQTFSLNAAGVQLIQDWIDGVRPNFGFVMRSEATDDGIEFVSRDDPTPNRRPRLTISYELAPAFAAEVHVEGMQMQLLREGLPRVRAATTITVLDSDRLPAEGVTVTVDWSGLTRESVSGTTDAEGRVVLTSSAVSRHRFWQAVSPGVTSAPGSFHVTVRRLEAEGRVHDPSADKVRRGCIDLRGLPCK